MLTFCQGSRKICLPVDGLGEDAVVGQPPVEHDVDALAGAHAHAGLRKAPEARGDRAPRARGVDHDVGAGPYALLGHDGLAPRRRSDRPRAPRGSSSRSRPSVCVNTLAPCSMASIALRVHRRAPSMPHSSNVMPPTSDADQTRLEARHVARVQPAVRLAALERLVVVVRAEIRVDELDGDAPLQARLDGHEERHAKQQVRRDVLDVPGVAAALLGDVRRLRQVAHAPVDHAAAVAAGAEGQIVALEDARREGRAARGRAPRRCR